MSGGSFLLKLFNEDVGGPYGLNVLIIENRMEDLDQDDLRSKLLHRFEVKFYLILPVHDTAFLNITKTIYRDLKKNDTFNMLELSTVYDDDDKYNEHALVSETYPEWIRNMVVKQGFMIRENLRVNMSRQKTLSEYSLEFFNLDYVEDFITEFRSRLKDQSNETISLKSFQ